MSILRFRVSGSHAAVNEIISRLHGVDNVERVEEVDDEISDMRDDSSSAESAVDDAGVEVHRIEVETERASINERVHDLMELSARDLDVAVEVVDRF
jgi:uncharacterized protein (UPF0335 family)